MSATGRGGEPPAEHGPEGAECDENAENRRDSDGEGAEAEEAGGDENEPMRERRVGISAGEQSAPDGGQIALAGDGEGEELVGPEEFMGSLDAGNDEIESKECDEGKAGVCVDGRDEAGGSSLLFDLGRGGGRRGADEDNGHIPRWDGKSGVRG